MEVKSVPDNLPVADKKAVNQARTIKRMGREGRLVCHDALKPFYIILNYADSQLWKAVVNDVRTFYAQNQEFYIPILQQI